MSTDNDYVPAGNGEFYDWQRDLIAYATSRRVGWGIEDDDWTPIIDEQLIYQPLYIKISNKGTRSPSDVEAHKNARALYEKMLRDFVQEWLAFNSAVTNSDRVSMAITVHSDIRTPRPAITTAPNTAIGSSAGGRINTECRVTGDSSKPSIHPDADGLEMRYIVATTAPATPENCPNVIIRTKARFTLQMNLVDAGKKVFAYVRWINTTDETKNGPWGTLGSAMITD